MLLDKNTGDDTLAIGNARRKRKFGKLAYFLALGLALTGLSCYMAVKGIRSLVRRRKHERYLRSYVPEDVALTSCIDWDLSRTAEFEIDLKDTVFMSNSFDHVSGVVTTIQSEETADTLSMRRNGEPMAKVSVEVTPRGDRRDIPNDLKVCRITMKYGNGKGLGIFMPNFGYVNGFPVAIADVQVRIGLPVGSSASSHGGRLRYEMPGFTNIMGNLSNVHIDSLSVDQYNSFLHVESVTAKHINMYLNDAPVTGNFTTLSSLSLSVFKAPRHNIDHQMPMMGYPFSNMQWHSSGPRNRYSVMNHGSQWVSNAQHLHGNIRSVTRSTISGHFNFHANTDGNPLHISFDEPTDISPLTVDAESSWGTAKAQSHTTARELVTELSTPFALRNDSASGVVEGMSRKTSAQWWYNWGSLQSEGNVEWVDQKGQSGSIRVRSMTGLSSAVF